MQFYRDLSRWYYAISFVGGISFVPLLVVLFSDNLNDMWVFLVWLVCMLIWMTCCVVFFQLQAEKRLKALAKICTEECRIEEFKNAWEGFQKQKPLFLFKQGRYNYDQAVKLNLSTAYMELGDSEKSLELLQSMPVIFVNNASGANYKITYYNNLAAVYLRLHNVEQTEVMLKQMKECLEQSKLLKSRREIFERAYQVKKVLLAMEQGNYEGAESFWRENLKKEGNKLTKVCYHYYLADVYRHLGNEEGERDCLIFVADNGGDSMYAREAGRRLEFLNLQ